jgi:hypothetical protein
MPVCGAWRPSGPDGPRSNWRYTGEAAQSTRLHPGLTGWRLGAETPVNLAPSDTPGEEP